MPTLGEVLTGCPAIWQGRDDVFVTGVSADSRTVRPGDIFVAVRGLADDGHRYLPDALAQGARAVVSEQAAPKDAPVPWVTVPDARAILGWLAACFQGFPARRLGLIGVTGTDGKTTTAHLVTDILQAAGWRVGLVSTVEVRLGNKARPNETNHTTPPAPILQALLAEMAQRRLDRVVLEVTSHALDQQRVAGCFFDSAIFTNLTPEHLNYHGDFRRYWQAKARLFAMLGREPKSGIPCFGLFNADDPSSRLLRSVCAVEQTTYGLDQEADYRVGSFQLQGTGTTFDLQTPLGCLEIGTPLVGRFNIYNAAAASAFALRLGIPADTVRRALRDFPGVPGRFQKIDLGQQFRVLVDFAHTPNALGAVLATLCPQTAGRLILVFGHPGGRDPDNRRALARVAAARADLLVLTNDDAYDEDPGSILDHIEAEVRAAGRRPNQDYLRIDDRRAAIALALRLAQPGDTVLIAGRGHLKYQIIGRQKIPLSDVEVARQELSTLLPMPTSFPSARVG